MLGCVNTEQIEWLRQLITGQTTELLILSLQRDLLSSSVTQEVDELEFSLKSIYIGESMRSFNS